MDHIGIEIQIFGKFAGLIGQFFLQFLDAPLCVGFNRFRLILDITPPFKNKHSMYNIVPTYYLYFSLY